MLALALSIMSLLVVTLEYDMRWATAIKMNEIKPLQLQGKLRVPLPLLRDEPIMIQGQPLANNGRGSAEPIELLKPLDQLMKLAVMLGVYKIYTGWETIVLHALFGRPHSLIGERKAPTIICLFFS